MKKIITKYLIFLITLIILSIIYLSVIGLETEQFNSQIRDKVNKSYKNLDIELKKIKLTFDPFKFKINAKTVGASIIYKGKNLDLEYIKTQISLNSLLKNKFVSSNMDLSTKSILANDLVAFIRAATNKPELFFLESAIKKGQVIVNLVLNFDENGKISNDYSIKGILKDGKIGLTNIYNFEKINFLFNIEGNNFNFRDVSFNSNNINFLSETLNIKKNKKNYLFKGNLRNKNSLLNDKLLKIIKFRYPQFDLINTSFESNNDFSFDIDSKFKVKNLAINSNILIDASQFKKKNLINKNFIEINDLIDLKDHKIIASYVNKKLSIEGNGKVKLQNKFEFIDYEIISDDSDYNLVSNFDLSELNIKNQNLIKEYFPMTNDVLNIKDHKIKLDYKDGNLLIKGRGKIKLDKEFNKIGYSFSKINQEYNFETDLEINDTPIKINFINYEKDKKLNSQLKINGSYTEKFGFDFKKISLLSKNNNFVVNDLILDEKNKIIKVDKINFAYLDRSEKKNKFTLNRVKDNNYELTGSLLNAESLITNLLANKDQQQLEVFKENINMKINLSNVYLDNENTVKNLNGKLRIVDNKVHQSKISAIFDTNESLTFTINTRDGEKITTLYSSRAKPLVNKYKFIKGFEDSDEGYLDFYSSKKNGISNSKLIIDNFKVKEIPALAKLLVLASLQGIADLLTGEGIRFTDLEMNFTNKNKLMTIQELYAIGPAISILIEGYIEEDNLVSLRGTLVPATTINRTIASIPLIGNLLIGKKAGEGVFGVSFKVKGPPKKLETTVNPIKTLTPRFITRTLEKIKKN